MRNQLISVRYCAAILKVFESGEYSTDLSMKKRPQGIEASCGSAIDAVDRPRKAGCWMPVAALRSYSRLEESEWLRVKHTDRHTKCRATLYPFVESMWQFLSCLHGTASSTLPVYAVGRIQTSVILHTSDRCRCNMPHFQPQHPPSFEPQFWQHLCNWTFSARVEIEVSASRSNFFHLSLGDSP